MEPREQESTYKLVIPSPLSQLIASCAVYCLVDCCGVNALDENAYQILHWVREVGYDRACESLEQLRVAINQVSVHDGPIAEQSAFCETWAHGIDCTKYLAIWHQELTRALMFSRDGCPSPEDRLREATLGGGPQYFREVRRLAGEADVLLHSGKAPSALSILSLIAELDTSDRSIADEVKWASQTLAESVLPRSEADEPGN